jgi:putative tryptophan/tyrosine transport system substrate-binding protein
MRRRDFITLVGGAAAWPLAARAQQPARMPRLGILLFSEPDRAVIEPMLRGLEALGYVDGKTIAITYRSFDGDFERLPKVIDELIRLNPDVIFSFGGEQALILKQATATIPLVVVVSNDPVATGLVASLARPGGNITGVTYVNDQLSGKAVELLKEVAPSVSRAAILWDPTHADPEFRETQRAVPALSSPLQLQSLEIREPGDFDGAFAAAIRERTEAVIVIGARGLFLHKQLIGDFAAKNRLILVGTPAWLTPIGGLLSYGADAAEIHRLAAGYVDKILKGAKPADLPMQQPATFELVINLKAAKALGLTIPATLLARADKVIE